MGWRAALIGCGKIGSEFADDPRAKGIQSHAQAYAASPQMELTGVCDADPAKAQACGARWKVKNTYTDPARLLAEQRPQIVSICTPDATHFAIARQVLNSPGVAGILLEKPLAMTLEEASQLVQLAREKNVKLAINYSRRYAASHRQLRQFIQSGQLGAIQNIHGSYTKGLLHNGTHWFDLVRFLIGEVKTVWGQDQLGEKSPDPTLDARLELARGATAYLQGCDATAFTVFEYVITGTRGRVRVSNGGDTFEFFTVADDPNFSGYRILQPVAGFSGGLGDALPNAVADLIAAVKENRPPACSGEDGLAALRLGLAVREAAVSGCIINMGSHQ